MSIKNKRYYLDKLSLVETPILPFMDILNDILHKANIEDMYYDAPDDRMIYICQEKPRDSFIWGIKWVELND